MNDKNIDKEYKNMTILELTEQAKRSVKEVEIIMDYYYYRTSSENRQEELVSIFKTLNTLNTKLSSLRDLD